MADIRKLYIDWVRDYDPYTDLKEHSSLNDSEMLYNLTEIKANNFPFIHESGYESEIDLYNRLSTLIDIFTALGIKPDLRG